MQRVLFVQRSINPPGGGNAIAAWMMQALASDYQLTLLCNEAPDWKAIDAFYATDLGRVAIEVRQLPTFAAKYPRRLGFLRNALLHRAGRALADEFDLLIGADGEADLGEKGLVFVHHPLRNISKAVLQQSIFKSPHPVAALYTRGAMFLGRVDRNRMRNTSLLTNSRWTADWIARVHGVTLPAVLYPPAAGEYCDAPWEERDDAVINLGRFSRDKRQEFVIRMVEKARERVPQLKLTLVASTWDHATEKDVRELARSRPWVRILTDVSREKLCAVLAKHRYGVHAMIDEHFGMAPAEMVRAGCIVLMPSNGGQTEIVDGDERFFFNERDAADRLAQIASSPPLQRELRQTLEALRERFTPQRFIRGFREHVRARLQLSESPETLTARTADLEPVSEESFSTI